MCEAERKRRGLEEEGSEALRDLHESSSTTFRIDLLETLFLLSLIYNAESSHKETQKNGHEPVDSGKDWIQSVIGLLCYGGHTERLSLGDKVGIGTECSAHLNKICSVEVTTTFEHVLNCNPGAGGLLSPSGVEVVPHAKSKEPNYGAGSSQIEHSNDKHPVEENEAYGNMVFLNHGSNRECPGNEEEYA